MSYIGSRLRELSRAIVALNRRFAGQDVPGVVAERDDAKWLVRVDLGEDPETSEKILSPWLAPRSDSAGALSYDSARQRFVAVFPDRRNQRTPVLYAATYGGIDVELGETLFLPAVRR